MSNVRYIVMCSVEGGVTGSRAAPLKDRNGTVRFVHREDAEAEAERLRAARRDVATDESRSNGPRLQATFRYWVEPEVW